MNRRPERGAGGPRAVRAAGGWGRRGTSGWRAARSSEKDQLPYHELVASTYMFMHIVGKPRHAFLRVESGSATCVAAPPGCYVISSALIALMQVDLHDEAIQLRGA